MTRLRAAARLAADYAVTLAVYAHGFLTVLLDRARRRRSRG